MSVRGNKQMKQTQQKISELLESCFCASHSWASCYLWLTTFKFSLHTGWEIFSPLNCKMIRPLFYLRFGTAAAVWDMRLRREAAAIRHLQEPERSCLISSFSGMSCMAPLIFSRIDFTTLCHFRLQWRRSSSQSVDTHSLYTVIWCKDLQE